MKTPQNNACANLVVDFFPSFNGQSEESLRNVWEANQKLWKPRVLKASSLKSPNPAWLLYVHIYTWNVVSPLFFHFCCPFEDSCKGLWKVGVPCAVLNHSFLGQCWPPKLKCSRRNLAAELYLRCCKLMHFLYYL